MSILGAILAQQNSTQQGDPDSYGGSLRLWLDAETGVTSPGGDVTVWQDRDNGSNFTVPAGGVSPPIFANSQNGLPGIEFDEQPNTNGILNRKLSSNASATDNHFNQGTPASIAFAGRINKLTDSRFNLNNTLVSKGFRDSGGWEWIITPDGSMEFRKRRSNNSTWKIRADGFYSAGDLVLAIVTYDGGNASNSGSMRLYNNSIDQFVTAGTVSLGTASGSGTDDLEQLVVGNLVNQFATNQNQPFQGAIFGVWFTRAALTFADEFYLRRWIP